MGVAPEEVTRHVPHLTQAQVFNAIAEEYDRHRPSYPDQLIDRACAVADIGPGSAVLGTTLGVEAIAEFSTQTNTYSAQFGGSGAAINAVTKSGTNGFHGSPYWKSLRYCGGTADHLLDRREPGAGQLRQNTGRVRLE